MTWHSKIIIVLELVFGWMYLAGLLPSVINLAASARMPTSCETRDDQYSGTLGIHLAIGRALAWLQESRRAWGGWRADLTPDVVASACVYRVLRDTSHDGRRVERNVEELGTWLNAEASNPTDPLAAAVIRVTMRDSLDPVEFNDTVTNLRATYNPDTHADMLYAIFACVSGVISPAIAVTVMPRDLDTWQTTYGQHWAVYATIAHMLQAYVVGDVNAVGIGAMQLASARSAPGTWHGDVMLTSIAILTLKFVDYGWTAQSDGKAWVLKVLAMRRPQSGGVSVVNGLEVWDTALALATLLRAGVVQGSIDPGVEWLSVCRRATDSQAWSWSEEGGMVCCDTTSLVCSVLSRANMRDTKLYRVLRYGEKILVNAHSRAFLWPSFLTDAGGIHYCPIVSARCVAVIEDPSGSSRRDAADAILNGVANDGLVSEWFNDAAITYGLVMWYLCPLCDPALPAANKILELLITYASDVHQATVEGAALPFTSGWVCSSLCSVP